MTALALVAKLSKPFPVKPVYLPDSSPLTRAPSALIAQSESTIGGDGGNSFSWNNLSLFVVNFSDVPQVIVISNNGRENSIVVGPRSYREFDALYRNASDLVKHSLSWNGKTLYFNDFRLNYRRGNKYDGGYIVGKEIGRGVTSIPLEVGAWATPQRLLDEFHAQQQQQQQLENSRRSEEMRIQAEAERRRAALQAEKERAKQLEKDQRNAADLEAKRSAKEQRNRENAIMIEAGTKTIDSLLNILFKK